MGLFVVYMPYSKVSNHPKCPANKPVGLVLTESNKLLGCHSSEESADSQIAAIESGKHKKSSEGPGEKELNMGEELMHYTRAFPDTTNIRAEDLIKDTSLPVPFIASTEGVKSDGMDLRMSDWILGRFQTYGPVLWVHGYTHPPLGRGEAKADDKLRVDVYYDEDDPFSMLIRNKAIKGMIAGSVGWATTRDKKNELIEFSMVPVGIDKESLPDIQRMGLRAMQSEISGILSEEPEDSLVAYIEELRNDVMEQILATLQEVVDEDEEEPEERGEDLDEEIVVGEEEEVETETEPEDAIARAGAMLSKKNR